MAYKIRDVLRKNISRYELVWKESVFRVRFSPSFSEVLTNASATRQYPPILEG